MNLPATAIPPELLGRYTLGQLFDALSERLLAETRNGTHLVRRLAAQVAEGQADGLPGAPRPGLSAEFKAEAEAVTTAAEQLRAHAERYMTGMDEFTSQVLDLSSRLSQRADELRAALARIEDSPRG